MFFIILVSFVCSASAYTCSVAQGPCVLIDSISTYVCPSGQGCIDDTTCCKFEDIVSSTTASPAKTTTAASTCVDKLNPTTGVSDCPKSAYLCQNAAYIELMKEQCPKTCGYCSGGATSATSSTCADKLNPTTGVSDCPKSAYLCQNAAYIDLMKDQCPKTCGYCT